MEKPIVLIKDELNTDIITAINNSKLPMWVVKDIIDSIANQVSAIAKEQNDQEIKAYYESIKTEEPVEAESLKTEE